MKQEWIIMLCYVKQESIIMQSKLKQQPIKQHNKSTKDKLKHTKSTHKSKSKPKKYHLSQNNNNHNNNNSTVDNNKGPAKQSTYCISKPNPQSKTSLQHRLLSPYHHKHHHNSQQPQPPTTTTSSQQQMLLTKSSQEHNKHPFLNSEIKKSIQLHKKELQKIRQNHYFNSKKNYKNNIKIKNMSLLNSEEKQCREMYYGNTTTERTRSGKKSSESKFEHKKQKTSKKSLSVKCINVGDNMKKSKKNIHLNNKSKQKNIQSPSVSHYHTGMKSAKKHNHSNTKQKQNKHSLLSTRKKQQQRLKKIESQYLNMLQQRLEQKQSEYNTIRTRNMLEEAKGMGGWVDGLSVEEGKRLRRIHQVEEEILQGEILQIKRQILGLSHSERNKVFEYYGGHYYDCEDVMSWIEGKD